MKGNRILKKMKYDIVLFYHVSYRLNSFFFIYAPDLPNNRQTNKQTNRQTNKQTDKRKPYDNAGVKLGLEAQ